MNKNSRIITSVLASVLIVVVLTGGLAGAAPMMQSPDPPGRLTYQGHLMDDNGDAVPDGNYVMTFRLYDAAEGGNLLWGPELHTVAVDDGYFTALLGRDVAVGPEHLASDTYLELDVSGDTMSPRHQLTSVAFALVAQEAISCTASAGVSVDGSLTGDGSAGDPLAIVDTYRLPQTCSSDEVAAWDGSAWACSAITSTGSSGDTWLLAGNTGAAGAVLGTTDTTPLTVVVNSNAVAKFHSNYTVLMGSNHDSDGGSYSVIGGGRGSQLLGSYATIGGGDNNTVSGDYATIGGGDTNTASGDYATIGGGDTNTASGDSYATVCGGRQNSAAQDGSTVIGGRENTASGYHATVVGGEYNVASGNNSFAAGRYARAVHNGSFVLADGLAAIISSTASNQFSVRASGGVTMYTSWDLTSGATLPPGSGSWSSLSDRDAKTNIEALDAADILARLADVEMWEWRYSASPDVRHVGPMAQDFHAAFGYGESERYISSIDADGVALAAIQALLARVEALEARVSELEAANE